MVIFVHDRIRLLLIRSLILALALSLCSNMTAFADCKPFIIDLYMGEPVPRHAMFDDLSTVRIVYLGEIHTIARHHELEEEVLRGLLDREVKLAIGMEMFARKQQPILDRWQRGTTNVSDLIKELGQDHWTNLQDYSNVLTLARKRHVPIIALNANDLLVHKVAHEGLGRLTKSEKLEIPKGVEKINPLLDRLLRLRLRVHKAFEKESLDRIVLAQALRDATMAQTVSRFLDSPAGKDRLMLVIAGSGHVNYGFGIPERVHAHNRLSYRIIVATESGELVLSNEEKRESVPIEITHEDLRFIQTPIADYLQTLPLKEKPK
ncbi:MAG: ChaN family lipoprotein [Desulfomonilaceae bacterium]